MFLFRNFSLRNAQLFCLVSLLLLLFAFPGRLLADQLGEPINFTVSQGIHTDKVVLSWLAPSGTAVVSHYKVYRSTEPAYCPKQGLIATLAAHVTSYEDRSIEPTKHYFYSLRAYEQNGEEKPGACSDTLEGYASAEPPPPPPVSLFATKEGADKILISWSKPQGGEEIETYEIYRSKTAEGCASGALVASIPVLSSLRGDYEYEDLTAEPHQSYYYSMRSRGVAIYSSCAGPVEGYWNKPGPPLEPTNFTATDGAYGDSIGLEWTPPQSDGVDGYIIYRSDSELLCDEELSTSYVLDGSSVSSYMDSDNVLPGANYYYSIRSRRGTQLSKCVGVDRGFARVGYPSNLEASDGLYSDRVLLSWTHPERGSVSGYSIYRSESPLSACEELLVTLPADASAYVDDTAEPSRAYYYSVRTDAQAGSSSCSSVVRGSCYKLPRPPLAVSASRGDYGDQVLVRWTADPATGPVQKYTLHRSLSPTDGCDASLVAELEAGGGDFSDGVSAGLRYYYWVKVIGVRGDVFCSKRADGYAKVRPPANLDISDALYTDRIELKWEAPANAPSRTGYILYRSKTSEPCGVKYKELAADLSAFSDAELVDEDVSVGDAYYHYSLKTLSSVGESVCSEVVRGRVAKISACSNTLDDDMDGAIDMVDPGCLSDPKRNLEKDPDGPACDNGIDDDGDGLIDFRVDGMGDPGCSSPIDTSEDDGNIALKSPAYAKFNTFLGQWNFAELINPGDREKEVKITVLNKYGQVMIEDIRVIPPHFEVDVPIHELLRNACDVLKSNCEDFEDLSARENAAKPLGFPDGIVDTYGLLRFEFDDAEEEERLLGRVSFYRPYNGVENFSFAFAREFRNSNEGVSYAVSNTIDPQGLGNLVPNWIEIVNLDEEPKSFAVNIYSQSGELVESRDIRVSSFGEDDSQAGHEYKETYTARDGLARERLKQGVYLVEVIPEDLHAQYLFSVSRYSSNSPAGVDAETYNFALSIGALPGTKETIFVPVSNRLPALKGIGYPYELSNWVEVVNVTDEAAEVEFSYRNSTGEVVKAHSQVIAPRSQYHDPAWMLLEESSWGSVDISSDKLIIAQSMSYVHTASDELQTGFGSPARGRGRARQVGSINTFLGMQNVLKIFSTSDSPVEGTINVSSFRGEEYTQDFELGSGQGSEISMNDAEGELDFPVQTYGAVEMKVNGDGYALGEVCRYQNAGGHLGFVMCTPLK